MEFSPFNNIVKLCLQGQAVDESGNYAEAGNVFTRARNEAANDFEKFLATHATARYLKDPQEKLEWFQAALQFALKVNDDSVREAFASLYLNIAKCYEALNDADNAKKNYDLAESFSRKPADAGPFYHGTRADLQTGDQLIAGYKSNYQADLTMNHIYFTGMLSGAGLAASMAKGEGRERVYIVEPTGDFENDPNVTDKKFPGNPTRSYRTDAPLKITGEVEDWLKLMPEELPQWREKLAKSKGEIIN